ncbi:MAG: DNA polymerase III subunit alpha [Anaerolineae bacterium]|jgi:error-prone DNA polymerase|nr:DNA polymerase III subunit alpha [Chloroflexota bacterium]
MDAYVELHAHSCFSLLDGAATCAALLDGARDLGMPAMGLTDHSGLYAAVEFALAARERAIHPVIGAELTLEDERHLVLLAESDAGYRNLSRLISRAQLEGTKARARLAWRHLEGCTEGLIALTGCRQGALAARILAGDREGAARTLAQLQELFPGRLYVELQNHLRPDDEALMGALADMARAARLPLVATNNVHYVRREGHRLQNVLTAIRHNLPLRACRNLLYPNSELYLKSGQEMAALFADYPEALVTTGEIASRCQVSLDFRIQAIPPVPETQGTPDEQLASLCAAGLLTRYPQDDIAAWAQLAHELEVISGTKLAGYFMLVWDIVRWAQEQGIQVRGRGSAANSIVAYLLGITNVDPLANNLLFERFLSPEARVMPDIDLDFCSRRREEVIQYVYDKYGEDHVGMVCNYVTYRSRSAVRDVGKALDLPQEIIDRLAKSKGRWGMPAEDLTHWQVDPALWDLFVTLCEEIRGYPRHLSIHVGGMCITAAPLTEIVPLERATMPGRVVIQWNKDNVEDAGLIKIDLLSLRTLSAIDETLRLINEFEGHDIDLDTLPLDDPWVYETLRRADTVTTFQVESRAQQQALVQMRPEVFNDLAIEVALIRPGPLQGNMVHPFFRRRQGVEPVEYMHPMLEPILAETLGVVVFQEQVIRVAMAMGGFSAGEADMLRRAMSRHRAEEEMAAFRERFVRGAMAQHVDAAAAEVMFNQLAGFASYGFCKSHAAAFAKTAYDTLWLRTYYPAAWYCGVLNNEPMGFYQPDVVVNDARRHGVRILPVHVNHSLALCTLEEQPLEPDQVVAPLALRLGFEFIAGLGEEGARAVEAARPAWGYSSLDDFCRRTRLPRKLVERLILARAMADWESRYTEGRRGLLWALGKLRYREDALPLPAAPDDVSLEPMTMAEELMFEYGATGVSAEGHMMELFREQAERAGFLTSRELDEARDGERMRIAGQVVVRQQPPTAKGFAFFTLEDEWALMNVIVRPQVFRALRPVWVKANIVGVEGLIERARGQINLMAERAWLIA